MQIAQAACRLAAYDFGFKGDLAWTQLSSWQRALGQSIESGEDAESALSPSHAGTKAYTNNIEHHHPGYIRELYRYAIKTAPTHLLIDFWDPPCPVGTHRNPS